MKARAVFLQKKTHKISVVFIKAVAALVFACECVCDQTRTMRFCFHNIKKMYDPPPLILGNIKIDSAAPVFLFTDKLDPKRLPVLNNIIFYTLIFFSVSFSACFCNWMHCQKLLPTIKNNFIMQLFLHINRWISMK